jgi:hypothetical protein
MNLESHGGSLYLGTASSFEDDEEEDAEAHIFRKAGADAPWRHEVGFGQGTQRVGALHSARFSTDWRGRRLNHERSVLMAGVSHPRRQGPRPPAVHVRDDATGQWRALEMGQEPLARLRIREMLLHRDGATGADLVFVGADPSPAGIYAAAFEPDHGLRWREEPELVAQRGKFFGMARANATLFASNRAGVFRRIDGSEPTWALVLDSPFPRGTWNNDEIRGLSAVPNPSDITGWPEPEMLVFCAGMSVYRMRASSAAAEHTIVRECDLRELVGEALGLDAVFAEGGFNRLDPIAIGGSRYWLIGFQAHFALTPPSGQRVPNDPRDPSTWRRSALAFYALRNERGQHAFGLVIDLNDPAQVLNLMRDAIPSPFPEEAGIIYATGFNGSYFKQSAATAWVYRGEPSG